MAEMTAEERAIPALKRALAFHADVLGALAELGMVTPAEGYLKPGSPRASMDIKSAIRQAEQAAVQREREVWMNAVAKWIDEEAFNGADEVRKQAALAEAAAIRGDPA